MYSSGNWHGAPGPCTVRFQYDALGRKVVTETWPEWSFATTTEHVYGTGPAVLEEYDIDTNAVPAATLARWFIHGESFPDPLVMVDLTDAGDLPAGQEERLYYLKDALGSIGALANAAGVIVERYVYDPYGQTYVLDPQGAPAGYLTPQAPGWYHDHDLDGRIDGGDCDHIEQCASSTPTDPLCVYLHDRNGNRQVDATDESLFIETINCNNNVPVRPSFKRPQAAHFDLDADGRIDLFDFYGLQYCFTSDVPEEQALCNAVYDLDADGSVTLSDLAGFTAQTAGPATPHATLVTTASRYGNPFAWTGQRYDPTNGMYHFWARSYSPDLGRFVQEDMRGVLAPIDLYLANWGAPPSLETLETETQREYANGLNLFLYVMANPASLRDVFGLTAWDEDIDDTIDEITAHRVMATRFLYNASSYVMLAADVAVDVIAELLGVYDILDSIEALVHFHPLNPSPNPFFVGGIGRVGLRLGVKLALWDTKFKRLSRISKTVRYILHHIIPKAVLDWLPKKVANDPRIRGVRGRPNKWHIPVDLHALLHGKGPRGGMYNEFFWQELKKLGPRRNITVDKVLKIREKAIKKFHLEKFRRFRP